jgi:hypothetical protein
MWLLDANMNVHLVSVPTSLGLSCDTAGNRGWRALSNGDLVKVAVDAGFLCMLTRDRLFGESASRALKLFPRFAVVVVNIPQRPWLIIETSLSPNGRNARSSRSRALAPAAKSLK